MVEDEDVMIDDISAIVIEFTSIEPISSPDINLRVEDRDLKRFQSLVIDSELIKGKTVVRNDPTRGSVALGEEKNDIMNAAIEVMHEEEGNDIK